MTVPWPVCDFCLADDHILCDPIPFCECPCPWLLPIPQPREAEQ